MIADSLRVDGNRVLVAVFLTLLPLREKVGMRGNIRDISEGKLGETVRTPTLRLEWCLMGSGIDSSHLVGEDKDEG
jgi:hypothetical protein